MASGGLPYFIDVVGYAFVQQQNATDPSQTPPPPVRRMLTRPHPLYEAGERVQGRLPEFVDGDAFNVEAILDAVFGPVEEPVSA